MFNNCRYMLKVDILFVKPCNALEVTYELAKIRLTKCKALQL